MHLRKNIKEFRKSRGIGQKEMALKLHCSISSYQKIEQGVMVLSLERFLEICRILKIESYNQLLPAFSSDIVEDINLVLIGGYNSFKSISSNTQYIRGILGDLREKIKARKIDIEKVAEELEFLDNYLAIIAEKSMKQRYDFGSMRDLIDKLD